VAKERAVFHVLRNYVYVVFVLAVTAIAASAEDWPMWRYDTGRTAASPGDLPGQLHLRWVRQYTPRVPVWDDPLNQDLMPYDEIFEPVVLKKTLFLGFNDSDKVVALDTDSGEERWRRYFDGPVRFAPLAWNGKLYVCCDDGYLYCLNATNGELIWKFRGGPSDRKILGNKRLISTWPVRGAPVIADGTIYFGASIWPMMGIFVCALDAETGEVIWLNDGQGADFILQPHNSPAFAGVAPQGYFVAAGDRLLVPGGRSVPAGFDRNTGAMQYYRFAEYNKTGGSFVAAIGNVYFNHYREGVVNMFAVDTGDALLPRIGEHPALTPDTVFFSGDSIRAFDLGVLTGSAEGTDHVPRWELEVDATADLIKSGSRLYAAGKDGLTAVELPAPGAQPAVAWRKRVQGNVRRLIAADGKLFAVTAEGAILCFGAEPGPVRQYLYSPVYTDPAQRAADVALEILDSTEVREGYALVHNVGDVEILEALADRSELQIVAIQPDAAVIDDWRQKLDDEGLYGVRVAVHEGTPFTFETPPYMASLTVVGALDDTQFPRDQVLLERIFHSMRPYGGKMCFQPVPKSPTTKLAVWIDGGQLDGLESVEGKEWVASREGPLAGAGQWTHMYGNIANTTKSDDDLVRLPLGVLWFGGSSNVDVLPRHGHGPPEQVIGGRLFIQGMNSMSARDVYTGRVLWKTELFDLGTFGMYFDKSYKDTPTDTRYNQEHIPGANIRGSNFVATEDRVYVIQGGTCTVLDAVSGSIVQTISLPPLDPNVRKPQSPPWAYIGCYEDTLFGGYGFMAFSDLLDSKKDEYSIWTDFDNSASKAIIAFDRHTGEQRWRIDATHGFLHNGIAVGNGIMYCLDRLPLFIEAQLERRGIEPPEEFRLIAVDVKTGTILWEEKQDVFGSFLALSADQDILLQSTRPSKDMTPGEDGSRMIAYAGSKGQKLWDIETKYSSVPMLHNGRIVTQDAMLDLTTGEPVTRINPLTGLDEPWTWQRQYGCNYPIASEHLLTFRSAAAGFYDFTNDGGTGNFGGFKSSCSSNLVAADGVLNAPDYTRTCSCSYQNQTSLALVHMPSSEQWTFNAYTSGDATIKKVGLNFGAPGDRRADDGVLWLDFPSVGGPSPEIPVEVTYTDSEPKLFRHYSSDFDGDGFPWVNASGIANMKTLHITLDAAATTERPYTVRLHFAEPESTEPGKRVFDVALQGSKMLEHFDIVQEAGKERHGIIKEFKNVPVKSALQLSFKSTGTDAPLLCGIEMVAEGW
jgi:outer membrane protein assembly factor BamB